MNEMENRIGKESSQAPQLRKMRGFTMIELMVTTVVFLIVAGAAFSLFNQHVALAARQQNLSGVNIGLRNAMAQLQVDLSGAGQNLLSSLTASPQTFSLGVIVSNSVPGVAATCTPNTSNWSYPISSACFDSFTVLNGKGCPVLSLDDPNGQTENLTTGTIVYGNDPNNSGTGDVGVPATLTTDASCYANGDEIAIVTLGGSGTVSCDSGAFNYCIGVVKLTANPTEVVVSGNARVQLTHTAAGASSDPLGIIYNPVGTTNYQKAKGLTMNYVNGATDYIIDLGTGSNDVTYAVQANAASNNEPQLLRCTGTSCTAANEQAITDQIISFKVGAALWNNAQTGATDIANYFYNSANYCTDWFGANCTTTPPPNNDPYDFTLIRAVRISLVGRTPPSIDATLRNFSNSFDGGPYLVQQASVVVDLRNLSDQNITN